MHRHTDIDIDSRPSRVDNKQHQGPGWVIDKWRVLCVFFEAEPGYSVAVTNVPQGHRNTDAHIQA